MAEIAGRLEADGVTQPFTKVLQARQDNVNAALRDLGIAEGDPGLIKRGLNPESAIVGEALERGVSREVIQSRRGLTPQRLDYHADDYLLNGRGVTAPQRRGRTGAPRPFGDDQRWPVRIAGAVYSANV